MLETLQNAVNHLRLLCKTSSIRSMHRLASGWDTQGVLPAMRLPQAESSSKPRGPLQFNFSDRSRKRLGWNHFMARLGH
jgi:hypothetical protein